VTSPKKKILVSAFWWHFRVPDRVKPLAGNTLEKRVPVADGRGGFQPYFCKPGKIQPCFSRELKRGRIQRFPGLAGE
jgi:hypothetical protein